MFYSLGFASQTETLNQREKKNPCSSALHRESAEKVWIIDYFLILMSSSFRTNFFLNASDIREAESSSLSEVHPRLYLNTVHNNIIHNIIY